MTLSLALNNALSGINVSQRSLAVLANNVANANTPGYSRQIVQLTPQVYSSQGSGVRIEQIVRKIDQYLHRATQQQTSAVGQTGTVSDFMSRIQVMLGEPGAANSMDEYIEGFFNAVQGLAETPELSSLRYEAVNSGRILAQEISSLATGLEDLRYQADQDIQTAINTINGEILRLRDINTALYRAAAIGEPVSNLLDARDISLSTLAEYMDITVNESGEGRVQIYTGAGIALLEEIPYQLQYNGVNALDSFVNDAQLSPITVDALKNNGTFVGRPVELVSAGVDKDITTSLSKGKLKGLLDMRDREIPSVLEQLDQIAAKMRDSFNAIHNTGSGFPPPSTLTGTRLVGHENLLEWTGTARIAALNENGTAPSSRYGDVDAGYLALDLDFDALRSEYGDRLTTDVIIREINSHFTPQNRAVVGNMNNIRMAAISDQVPDGGNFTFDFELENISDTNSNFWVTNVQVLDDTATDITSVTSTYPTALTLDAANTFTTVAASNVVTVQATGHGLSAGDVVYLNGVSGAVDGIPAAEFNGQAFRITNVTANTFDIEVVTQAAAGMTVNDGAVTALEAYETVIPGKKDRTGDNGDITLDLSGNLASQYYTVRADVMVEDSEGNVTTTTVEYRVPNNETSIINKRYPARSAGVGGALEVPSSGQPLVVAQLIDEEGNIASPGEDGYLRLVGQPIPGEPGKYYSISIDDMSSKDLGLPAENPPQQGTGRGFSHYFELNNFFVSNKPNTTGDKISGSAIKMAVRQDILDNPNYISMGTLSGTPDSSTLTDHSYERAAGENSVAAKLAALGLSQQSFTAAGGLPSSVKTFNGYASEVLGYMSGKATTAEGQLNDEQALLEGYQARAQAVSGVNMDEEMANTIIFQNAFAANAQVISVINEMFDALIAAF